MATAAARDDMEWVDAPLPRGAETGFRVVFPVSLGKSVLYPFIIFSVKDVDLQPSWTPQAPLSFYLNQWEAEVQALCSAGHNPGYSNYLHCDGEFLPTAGSQ